jgi:hypothetical protein
MSHAPTIREIRAFLSEQLVKARMRIESSENTAQNPFDLLVISEIGQQFAIKVLSLRSTAKHQAKNGQLLRV